jgi:hypothetical protein
MYYNKLKSYFSYLIPSMMLVLLLSSCETLDLDMKDKSTDIDTSDLPKWTISINEIVKYPRASRGEKEVPTFGGRTIWVRKHYEFNSKSIISITTVPAKEKANYFNLKVKLDRHGSLVAMRLSNDATHAPWAFLVDGVYYRSVEFNEPPLEEDYSEIIIKGPFDKSLASFLEKYSEPNYEHLHPND